MLYMIIEHYKKTVDRSPSTACPPAGPARAEGLRYINSWSPPSWQPAPDRECDDRRLLDDWIGNWSDLVEFEVIRS